MRMADSLFDGTAHVVHRSSHIAFATSRTRSTLWRRCVACVLLWRVRSLHTVLICGAPSLSGSQTTSYAISSSLVGSVGPLNLFTLAKLTGIGFWFHSHEAAVASAAYLQLSAALEPIREPSQTLFHWLANDVIGELFVPPRGRPRARTGRSRPSGSSSIARH